MVLCRITAIITTGPTDAIWAAEPATTALMIAKMHTIEKAGRNGSTAFTTFGSR